MKILICGAGLVGLAAGYKLKQDHDVTIIEKNASISYQQKALALNFQTINYLCQSLELEHFAIKDLVIAKYGNILRTKLQAGDFELPYFGAVYCAEQLGKVLHEECKDLVQLSTAYEPKLKNEYDLILACDGTFSEIRTQTNIEAKYVEYERQAIVLTAKGKDLVKNTAYEFFIKQHTMAVLPNGAETLKIVILAQTNSPLHKANNKQLLNYVHKTLNLRMGSIERVEKIASYPFIGMLANKLNYENIVLLGNSASSFSPVAAQSLNLAIQDLRSLEELIQNSGDLNLYNQKRFPIHQKYFNYINKLETKQNLLPNVLYEFGFLALNSSKYLSRALVNWGAGSYA